MRIASSPGRPDAAPPDHPQADERSQLAGLSSKLESPHGLANRAGLGHDPHATHLPQGGLRPDEEDSGGVAAMARRFAKPSKLVEFLAASNNPANVKRHNTAAWITGRIAPEQYSRLPIRLDDIRCQHDLNPAAMGKTRQRAQAIAGWLHQHPDATVMDVDTLNAVAGSTGHIKVGWGGGQEFLTLDGTGRVEAVRQALAMYAQQLGHPHPLQSIEAYGARLSSDEYDQLRHVSTFFLDEQGEPKEPHEHDLMPMSGMPRLVVGTAMNVVKQMVATRYPETQPDRRLPATLLDRAREQSGGQRASGPAA